MKNILEKNSNAPIQKMDSAMNIRTASHTKE
jgi:hypothetical protein